MNFWTSDNHFGHKNIIKYCGRPFADSVDMDRTMIQRWNAVVAPSDTVYHLGDFSMHKKVGQIQQLRKKLNGRIVLVRGNHDRSDISMREAGFDEVYNAMADDFDGYRIYMAHIPVTISDPHPRKYPEALTKPPPIYYDYWLCGHVHEKWRRRRKVVNVGVDQWDFTPRRLDELLAAKEG